MIMNGNVWDVESDLLGNTLSPGQGAAGGGGGISSLCNAGLLTDNSYETKTENRSSNPTFTLSILQTIGSAYEAQIQLNFYTARRHYDRHKNKTLKVNSPGPVSGVASLQ